MLAFAVQYGGVLKIRNNLDVASRDAARYLARAPLNSSGSGVDQVFIDRARQMIEDRVENADAKIASFAAASDATTATVNITIDVPFPFLEMIALISTARPNIQITTTENWTRTGDGIVTSSSTGS